MFSKLELVNVIHNLYISFLLYNLSVCKWVWGKRKRCRVHVLGVHLQVHILWECLTVFVYVCLGPMGQGWRSGEWVAHSCFSAHCRLRLEGWADGLLTTSPSPSATSPHFYHWGARDGQEERSKAALNSTHCPCLLFQIQHTPLSLSRSSVFLSSQTSRVLWGLRSLFISMSEFLTDGCALVEQQSGYEMW